MALKTLDNALELLQYFTKETPSWGVRELAKAVGVNHSIVYRILSTYEKHGFLKQNLITKKYELGFKFLEYGLIIQESLKVTDVIRPLMEEVTKQTGESVFLTWLDQQEAVCVEVTESPNSIKFQVNVGSRTEIHAGASNKVIMAYLPEEVQLQIIEKGLVSKTSKTLVDPNQLLNNLKQIRQQGWCYSVGEFTDEVVGIAAPLFNHQQQIIASITVAGPTYRIPPEKVEEILKSLLVNREKIQNHLNRVHVGQYLI